MSVLCMMMLSAMLLTTDADMNKMDYIKPTDNLPYNNEMSASYYSQLPKVNGVIECGDKITSYDYNESGFNIETNNGYKFKSLCPLGRISTISKPDIKILHSAVSMDTLYHMHTYDDNDASNSLTGWFNVNKEDGCYIEEQVDITSVDINQLKQYDEAHNTNFYLELQEVFNNVYYIGDERYDIYRFKYIIGNESWDVFVTKTLCINEEEDLYSIRAAAYKESNGRRTIVSLVHKNIPNDYLGYSPSTDDKFYFCIHSLECILSTLKEVN